MHTYGVFYNTSEGFNLVYGVLINSLFNTGVSIFVLISGYFGINNSLRKYLRLEMEVLFYSILNIAIMCGMQNSWELKEIVKACFPIASGKYWYLTSYVLLMIFSKYIDKAPEKLTKKEFERLLLLLFFVFSAVPTIIQFHVMNDGGKGFANMLLMYYIGRYIRLYWDGKCDCSKILVVGSGAAILGFGANMAFTMLRGGKGIYAPFARDCSSIIVVVSISIFLAFKQLRLQSKIINCIASHVVAVYLFEGTLHTLILKVFDIKLYGQKWYLFLLLGIYAIVLMVCCIVIDMIRKIVARPLEHAVWSLGNKGYGMFHTWIDSRIKR